MARYYQEEIALYARKSEFQIGEYASNIGSASAKKKDFATKKDVDPKMAKRETKTKPRVGLQRGKKTSGRPTDA